MFNINLTFIVEGSNVINYNCFGVLRNYTGKLTFFNNAKIYFINGFVVTSIFITTLYSKQIKLV